MGGMYHTADHNIFQVLQLKMLQKAPTPQVKRCSSVIWISCLCCLCKYNNCAWDDFMKGRIDYKEFYITPLSMADAELWRLTNFWRQTRVTFRETSLFFRTSVMSSLFQPQRFTLDLHPYILCICPHMTFYLLRLLHWAPDMTVARQAEHVCVCVNMHVLAEVGPRHAPIEKKGWWQGQRSLWMTFGPAAAGAAPCFCFSVTLLTRHSPWCQTHTHTHFRTPAHSQTHDPAYTHTHARMCRHICKFEYLLKRPVDTYTHNGAQ